MDFIDKQELPESLNRLKNPPKKLFYVGNKSLLKLPKIAIVGSRKASVYTKNCVLQLASVLKNHGICVVSGGALGVDILAHVGAMPNTIGVFANGLDTIYPKTNEKTIREIYKHGLALSEYEPESLPVAYKFIQRNRIVVSLCNAVVIAQADIKSGSMQSAKMACELGVPVYVLAQRYSESDGTNYLLANSKAKLIGDFNEFATSFGTTNYMQESTTDEFLGFCKNGVSLQYALDKFGDIVYEYELNGLIKIENLRVIVV
ncbi:DNA-processing protein DprA [Campylobacter pinnipediorum]|uniref:DNA-processing protein DprA n=1 Tax=Campylobacter pinnipediorum TaxID=1965231 RepID=UPI00084DC2B8|nr:DNA-processing protein DprA [Campylobacter pinnipediorum]